MFLGGKTTAWVGAIIVVLGSAFAIREFGTGFWGALPDTIKALIVAGFGALLLGCGELAFRRIGRAASVGLFSAGLGILYLDAYATYQWFAPPVTSQEISFVLMAIVAASAFAITLRTRSLTIGVLSLIGGYLTPILLSGGGGQPLPIMVYLTILAGVALMLAARMPESFSPLRYVALGGQMLLGLAVIIGYGSSHWMMMLVFPAIWWTMFLGEAVLTAMRGRSPIGNVVSTLIATAAFVTVGGWVLIEFAPPAGEHWLGAFTLMIAGLSAAAALHFGPGLETLRGILRSAMDKLALSLWVQSGVLLPLAIALQFDGYGASVGWLALAMGCVEIGRRLPSRGVSIFALIIGSMALVRILTIDQLVGALQTEVWSWRGVSIDRWAILAMVALVALHIAARRIGLLMSIADSTQSPTPVAPFALAAIGMIGWMLLCLRQMEGAFVTGGWLLGAAALLAVEPFGKRQRYLELAMMVLAFSAARWFFADALAPRLESTWSASESLPLLNWQMATAMAIATCGWWALRRMQRQQKQTLRSEPIDIAAKEQQSTWIVQFALLVGVLFMLVAMSFEIDRTVTRIAAATEGVLWSVDHVRQLMLTMLWTVGSVGLGILAIMVVRTVHRDDEPKRKRHDHLLLRCAWGLLIACTLKWVFADTLLRAFHRAPEGTSGLMPIANVQLLVGFVIAAAALTMMVITSASRSSEQERVPMPWTTLASWTPVAVSFIVLWGLTFEVDRLLGTMTIETWPAVQLRMLWWTGLWAVGGITMMLFGQWRQLKPMFAAGWGIIALSGLAWLFLDTLPGRLSGGVADVSVIFNLQFMIGLLVAVLLSGGAWMILRCRPGLVEPSLAIVGFASIAAIGLWLGSLEIDRFFATNAMGKQMGLSVYWMLYGVLLVLVGFARHVNACRYVGLALLTITVAKVLLIDLANVEQIWRVVSLIVSGLLLIVTSVAYRKFASRLLDRRPTEPQPM